MTGHRGRSRRRSGQLFGFRPQVGDPGQRRGRGARGETFEGEIFLPLRDQAGAVALAKAVSSPLNSGYRKGLSPTAWIARFSPTKADFNANVAYLKSQGLTIFATPANREYVVFRGTAAQLGAAFWTTLHTYAVDKHRIVGPSRAPSVPSALASKVSGISLDQSRMLTRPDLATPEGGTAVERTEHHAQGCGCTGGSDTRARTTSVSTSATVPPAYNGQTVSTSTYICGYTPSQLRSAYGLDKLNKAGVNGSGTDRSRSSTRTLRRRSSTDANTYATAIGEPGLTGGPATSRSFPSPSEFVDQALCQEPSGWQGGADARRRVVARHRTGGEHPLRRWLQLRRRPRHRDVDDPRQQALEHREQQLRERRRSRPDQRAAGRGRTCTLQAAGEGIGLYFSSGDNGDEVANLGYASPDFAASSPWVTSVGGTSIGIDKNGKIAYETGWGDTRDQIIVELCGHPGLRERRFRAVHLRAASGRRRRWDQRGLRGARLPAGHRSDVALAWFPGLA